MPMVSFPRLYALRHQINQTHTLERIEALTERNIILPANRDEIAAAYDFLMQLRLQTRPRLDPGRPFAAKHHPSRQTGAYPAGIAQTSIRSDCGSAEESQL